MTTYSASSYRLDDIYVHTLPYGECLTDSALAEKTVDVGDFALEKGVAINVNFAYANTASAPTLNVNSTGARPVYVNGEAASDKDLNKGTHTFVYNGNQWEVTTSVVSTEGLATEEYVDEAISNIDFPELASSNVYYLNIADYQAELDANKKATLSATHTECVNKIIAGEPVSIFIYDPDKSRWMPTEYRKVSDTTIQFVRLPDYLDIGKETIFAVYSFYFSTEWVLIKASSTKRYIADSKLVTNTINAAKYAYHIDLGELTIGKANEIEAPAELIEFMERYVANKNVSLFIKEGDYKYNYIGYLPTAIYQQDEDIGGEEFTFTTYAINILNSNEYRVCRYKFEYNYDKEIYIIYKTGQYINTIPNKVSQLENDSGFISSYTETDPTVPDWAKASSKPSYSYSEITETPTLATVATSGNYNDLIDKPTIPTVPTDISAFNNDKGYLTSYTETDPTVPDWAKAPNKPSYTASEVGADTEGSAAAVQNKLNEHEARTDNPHGVTASQVKAEPVGAVSTHNIATDAHNDIRLLVSGLTERLNALANSDDTTLDQMAEVVAYIKDNRDLISQITTNKVNVTDIVNDLTTNVSNKPLSAAQGVVLKALIDAITVPTKVSELDNDKGYLTSFTESDPTVPSWAKQSSKPSYNKSEVGLENVDNVKQYSASNPPPYPVTSVNGQTGAVSISVPTKVGDLDNDKGYLTSESDPTVPAWAKEKNKPSYTASEVGARPDTWTPSASDVEADPAGSASAALSEAKSYADSIIEWGTFRSLIQ